MNHHGGWSSAYMACFLSHFETWRTIAASNDDYAAIYEDDAHLSIRLPEALRLAEDCIHLFDIIRLETTLQGMRLGVPVLCRNQTHVTPVINGGWGCAGYIIRKDIAAWLIACPPRFHYTPDWMLFHNFSAVARSLQIGQYDPALCVQDQYLPDKIGRLNFDNETSRSAPLMVARWCSIRKLIIPFARRLSGRKVVKYV